MILKSKIHLGLVDRRTKKSVLAVRIGDDGVASSCWGMNYLTAFWNGQKWLLYHSGTGVNYNKILTGYEENVLSFATPAVLQKAYPIGSGE